MALYSDKVMDHFLQPRNLGVIENADGVGEVGNAKCGDIMKMYLKIDDDIITDVKFETFGCAYAPFILTVDWLGWVCYLPDKLEFILSYHVLPS